MTQQAMLVKAGYRVASVLGNETAIKLCMCDADIDAVVLGWDATINDRSAVIQCLKSQSPTLPVLALRQHVWDEKLQADANMSVENPDAWIQSVEALLADSLEKSVACFIRIQVSE